MFVAFSGLQKSGSSNINPLDQPWRLKPKKSPILAPDVFNMSYEKIRKANMDRRIHIDKSLTNTIWSHGVAGLLIDPENVLVSLASSQSRTSPRRGTAFHHTHLSQQAFETIAKSLAEGVSVAATARIQNVDKKTVLLVLAKSGEQAKRVNRSLLMNVRVTECQLDEMWSFIGSSSSKRRLLMI